MQAMVLRARGGPLILEERPDPVPGLGELRIRVEACAVCRTDLHVIDGELPHIHYPTVPGHEIVGIVEALGPSPGTLPIGQRVGIPWLGRTCGHCEYCMSDRENLCDAPTFTGYDRDGGFATHVVADAAFAVPLDDFADPVAAAPLLCAGLIGWRSLLAAGEGKLIGELVPAALKAVKNGGTVFCGGIYMSDIPSFPYSILWEERRLVSVANLTA
jgi:propanol-preferring alcohol dehydrogenase